MFDEARDSLEKVARRMKKYEIDSSDLEEDQQQDKARRVQTKRALLLVMKQFDREIEKILDHRTMRHSRKNRRTDFLVQWKETSEAKATWERDVTLWKFETMVQAYWQTKSTRVSTLAGGGGFVSPLTP
ncbi:hypothetical protein AAG906_029009 [Vitis piasezkii]